MALEERIDADLSLGLHAELVAELEALAARYPLQERLREQLMLALYRSGRQAEALEVYRDTRRLLAEELGIEPSTGLQELERAILRHDPQLEVAGALAAAPRRKGPLRLRPRRRLVVATAAALAVVATALALAFRGDGTLARVAPNSVAVIDPARNALVAEVPVGDSPGSIGASGGTVWVLNRNSWTISGIDVPSRRVRQTIGTLSPDVTAVAGFARGSMYGYALTDVRTGTLQWFDPEEAGFLSVLLREPGRALAPVDVVFANGEAWVAAWPAEVIRVRPGITRSPTARISLVSTPTAVAAGDFVWIATADDSVAIVDPERNEVVQTLPVGRGPRAIALGTGAAWIANARDGTVTRISERPREVKGTIRVGREPSAIAVGAGAVWVVNAGDGTVSRVDPATDDVVATIDVGHRPQDVVVAGGLVWVSVRAG